MIFFDVFYSYIYSFQGARFYFHKRSKMVEDKRIELLTPCVQGRCSPS